MQHYVSNPKIFRSTEIVKKIDRCSQSCDFANIYHVSIHNDYRLLDKTVEYVRKYLNLANSYNRARIKNIKLENFVNTIKNIDYVEYYNDYSANLIETNQIKRDFYLRQIDLNKYFEESTGLKNYSFRPYNEFINFKVGINPDDLHKNIDLLNTISENIFVNTKLFKSKP